MMLKNICEKKDCGKEDGLASESWKELSEEELPACKGENGGFMTKEPYQRTITHVYKNNKNCPQSRLRPKTFDVPAYSFFGVPYRYLSRNSEFNNEVEEIFSGFREEEKAPWEHNNWTYGRERQYDILEWFRSNIIAGESLVTFYCKNSNPVDEDARRIIIGIGEIENVAPLMEYDSDRGYSYPLWEQMMTHTIREDLKKSRGFLLPYHEYLALDEEAFKDKGLSKKEAINEIKLTLDKLGNNETIINELSYGCDYVSNHNMLIILNAARHCLESVRRHGLVGGDWDLQLRWIDEKVSQVKSLTGPFPSFGEGLRALGINYAYLIEQDLRNGGYCGQKDNPWKAFDKLVRGKIKIPNAIYNTELPQYRKTWQSIGKDAREVIELLSRFETDASTIEEWYSDPDSYEELMSNPYILSEERYLTPEQVDLGVIADPGIQGSNIPQSPSCIDTKIDERRIRAYAIYKLDMQSLEGDTLMSIKEITEYINEQLAQDKMELPVNFFKTYKDFMSKELVYIEDSAIQLHEFYEMENFLYKTFKARARKEVKTALHEDWRKRVTSVKGYDCNDERSVNAAERQIRALEMISKKRLSVLTGAAGTGKTSVVQALLNSEQIANEGVLLLAPTGKARVKLGRQSDIGEALTIAQFLTRQGFFDCESMTAYINEKGEKYSRSKNVIIDECSMITTNDFYVLLKALDLSVINRIILIGDPYQLPPIGDGRTFSDLCHYLEEEVPDAITTLNIVVRTINTGDSDILALASWFSGVKPDKNADTIFDKMQQNELHGDMSVYTWKDETELKKRLAEVIKKELHCNAASLSKRLRKKIGMDNMDKAYKCPDVVERFQVLTPVKNPVWGTFQINQYFQEWLESNTAYSVRVGTNTICVGDKVIQQKNIRLRNKQLSNGQIGFVKYADKKGARVCFSGYPEETFNFYSTKSDEEEPMIDLAYAITIHKSQGSDFETVLVVLPKSCRILSRELIYTALTRAKKNLILLVEDNLQWLMEYSKPQQSILARRNTNLFEYSVREEKVSIPYVEGLIHKTLSGAIVRSKSEVIIADALYNESIPFEYEKLLEANNHRCIPDFTFVDASGDTIIWEHLGMLDNPSYAAAWKNKLSFYESIGYREGENLFTTRDHEGGSIDSNEIQEVVDKIKALVDVQPHVGRRRKKR